MIPSTQACYPGTTRASRAAIKKVVRLRRLGIVLAALLGIALWSGPTWARGRIAFGSGGGQPDRLTFKAIGVPATELEPQAEGVIVTLSNVTGAVLSESVAGGLLIPNAARTRWRFSTPRGDGIYRALVTKKMLADGKAKYTVKVKIDGDLAATDPVRAGIAADLLAPMLVTFGVGDDSLASSMPWEPLRAGWRTRSDTLRARYFGPAKRVFVTSECYLGSLEGLAGADQKCQSLANGSGIDGEFSAWLADAYDGPLVRLPHAAVPYVLVDGSVVARDWGDLTDGEVSTAVNLDESGNPVDGGGGCGAAVWTNTSTLGTPAVSDALEFACYEWTLSLFSRWGLLGDATATDGRWTDRGALAMQRCSSTARLYCFER
jgi:hypothetical protein